MEQIKSIFYKEIANPYSNNQYGLKIIILMLTKCLYFDCSSFCLVKSSHEKFNTKKWNIVKNLTDNKIIGIQLAIKAESVAFVRKLDAQGNKTIFGGGFLLSEKAAAEKAAAEKTIVYELSEREKAIIRILTERSNKC